MQNRLLTLINVLLVLVCAGCIYYLVNYSYQEPNIEKIASVTETNHGGPESSYAPPSATPVGQTPEGPDPGKNVFRDLFTPTPTPEPTPTPTPAPPDLTTAVYGWQVTSLDEGKAGLKDKNGQEFEMQVGGQPHESPDGSGRPVFIQLKAVDLEGMKVTLGTDDGQAKQLAF